MKRGGTTNIVISAVLGIAAFVICFEIGRAPSPRAESSSKPRPKSKLTALSAQSAESVVRNLISAGASPSKIWQSMENCSSEELGKLLRLTYTSSDSITWMNQLLVLARWIEIDPAAATDSVAAQWGALSNLPTAMSLWADLDPESALDHLAKSQNQSGQAFAYGSILDSARRNQDPNLQALYKRLPRDKDDIKQTHTTGSDQLSILRGLLTERDQHPATAALIDWMIEDFAVKALENHPASEVMALYSEDTDMKFGEPPASVLSAHYQEDPAATTQWIFDHHDRFAAARMGANLVDGLSDTQPNLAAEALEFLPESASRDEVMTWLADDWSTSDNDAYSSWYRSLPSRDRETVDQWFVDKESEDE